VEALLLTVTVPETAPLDVGLNVTLRGMFPPDAIENGAAGALAILKPGPATESAETEILEEPLFCKVTVNVLVVPTATLPKAAGEGEASTATVGAALDTETFGGEPAPLVPQPVMEPIHTANAITPHHAVKRRI
jgi:hypothetical protein